MKKNIHFFIIYHSVLLRLGNVSGTVVEEIKTHVLCSVTFSQKSCRLWENVKKK